jgi:hypothetical protein
VTVGWSIPFYAAETLGGRGSLYETVSAPGFVVYQGKYREEVSSSLRRGGDPLPISDAWR